MLLLAVTDDRKHILHHFKSDNSSIKSIIKIIALMLNLKYKAKLEICTYIIFSFTYNFWMNLVIANLIHYVIGIVKCSMFFNCNYLYLI